LEISTKTEKELYANNGIWNVKGKGRANDSMINKIFHISDIHIRLYRRSREYQSVLENLISIINERKDKNSIIIVTGDIFHSKTEMSPESVSLGTLFLSKLS